MVEKRVKSIYRGYVAFHEKYADLAVYEGQGLRVLYEEDGETHVMEIPADEVEERRVTEHPDIEIDKEYQDQHGSGSYKLAYFEWRGKPLQDTLL